MKYVSFGEAQMTEAVLAQQYPLLYNIMSPLMSMRVYDAKVGSNQFHLMCRPAMLCVATDPGRVAGWDPTGP